MIRRLLPWPLALLALLAPALPAADEAADGLLGGRIAEVLDQGGPVLLLILVGSVIALALGFERAVATRRRRLVPRRTVRRVEEGLAAGDLVAVEREVAAAPGPLGEILGAGLARRDLGARAAEEAMEGRGARVVGRLERSVRPLALLASIQPLLGLLGTILGMIGTFDVLHDTAPSERVARLAPGIGQALYTTAAGLCAAIPCLILHHWLSGRVQVATEEWNRLGSELVARLARVEAGAAAGGDAPRATASMEATG